MNNNFIHLRRIYVADALNNGVSIAVDGNKHHYIRNVMRMAAGDQIRVFNADHGEWLARLDAVEKKQTQASVVQHLRPAFTKTREIILCCPILAKDRMDFLIEKGCELGMTAFQPIITDRSEITRMKEERIEAQMIEACEQCERLDMPALRPIMDMKSLLSSGWPSNVHVYAAMEREDAPVLAPKKDQNMAILIGPPGGWSDEEKAFLNAQEAVQAITLGETVLRTETAALKALSQI